MSENRQFIIFMMLLMMLVLSFTNMADLLGVRENSRTCALFIEKLHDRLIP